MSDNDQDEPAKRSKRWVWAVVVLLLIVVSLCLPAAFVYCGLSLLPPSFDDHVGRLLLVVLPIAAIGIVSDAWVARWLTRSMPLWAAVAVGVALFVVQCALSAYMVLLVALGAMFSGRMPE